VVAVSFFGDDLLDGSRDNDRLEGQDGLDTLLGGDGDDTLLGGEDADTLVGGLGNDTYNGGLGFDFADFTRSANSIFLDLSSTSGQFSQEGTDTFLSVEGLIGSAFGDALIGGTAAEMFIGGGANDSLHGAGGADTLQGGKGKDLLIGRGGKDILTGGTGVDTFKYFATSDSTAADPDRITDLEAGDVIDLSEIDANTHSRGNQAFVLRTTHTGTGQAVLSYNATTDRTTLSLYVDSGDTVDAQITMNGDHTGHTGFVL
jgi:Ca2+-binding RTX toxin-like protein